MILVKLNKDYYQVMDIQKIQKLKNSLKDYEAYCSRLFLKQGSFSFYHSKEIDRFIEDVYELVLNDFLMIIFHIMINSLFVLSLLNNMLK